MRFLLGLIIGIALTIGAARLHDTNLPPPGAGAPPGVNGPVVNWDTLDALVRQYADFLHAQWNRIFH